MTQKATIDEIQKVANKIRKQILGVALEKGGCYLSQACSSAEIVASLYMEIMNLGPSTGNPEPIPFPGVPGPDNMDYPKGAYYNGCYKPTKPGLLDVMLTKIVSLFHVVTMHQLSTVHYRLQVVFQNMLWINSTLTVGIWK